MSRLYGGDVTTTSTDSSTSALMPERQSSSRRSRCVPMPAKRSLMKEGAHHFQNARRFALRKFRAPRFAARGLCCRHGVFQLPDRLSRDDRPHRAAFELPAVEWCVAAARGALLLVHGPFE